MIRAILTIALVAAPLFADEVRLRGGGRLTGEITTESEESITIDIGAGTMTVPKSTIVGIDRGTSSLQEYRARAATLGDDDVEGWRTLGRWAVNQGLSQQAHDAYVRVHEAIPDDAEANRSLGLVLYDGRWIPEEESYAARGLVKFGGDWMTPGERDAILREQLAREEQTRQAVAAEVKVSEAERKEREAEDARREEAEARRNRFPTLEEGWAYWGSPAAVWPN